MPLTRETPSTLALYFPLFLPKKNFILFPDKNTSSVHLVGGAQREALCVMLGKTSRLVIITELFSRSSQFCTPFEKRAYPKGQHLLYGLERARIVSVVLCCFGMCTYNDGTCIMYLNSGKLCRHVGPNYGDILCIWKMLRAKRDEMISHKCQLAIDHKACNGVGVES